MGEKIYNIWELPKGARVPVHYVREGIDIPREEGDCIAVFDYIDWMYWRWHQEWAEPEEIINFNAKFKHIKDMDFEIYEE